MSEKTNTETALARIAFDLPSVAMDGEFSKEELAEDMEGVRMTFRRVKMPSGGGPQFEIAGDSPENPEFVTTLQGVIIYHHTANAYWVEDEDDTENVPPICSSIDGKQGFGTPGGACVLCSLNDYGTKSKGKGKACSATRS